MAIPITSNYGGIRTANLLLNGCMEDSINISGVKTPRYWQLIADPGVAGSFMQEYCVGSTVPTSAADGSYVCGFYPIDAGCPRGCPAGQSLEIRQDLALTPGLQIQQLALNYSLKFQVWPDSGTLPYPPYAPYDNAASLLSGGCKVLVTINFDDGTSILRSSFNFPILVDGQWNVIVWNFNPSGWNYGTLGKSHVSSLTFDLWFTTGTGGLPYTGNPAFAVDGIYLTAQYAFPVWPKFPCDDGIEDATKEERGLDTHRTWLTRTVAGGIVKAESTINWMMVPPSMRDAMDALYEFRHPFLRWWPQQCNFAPYGTSATDLISVYRDIVWTGPSKWTPHSSNVVGSGYDGLIPWQEL